MNIIMIFAAHNYTFHISLFTQHQTTIVLVSHVLAGAASRGSECVFIHQTPVNQHWPINNSPIFISSECRWSTRKYQREKVESLQSCLLKWRTVITIMLFLKMTMCINDNLQLQSHNSDNVYPSLQDKDHVTLRNFLNNCRMQSKNYQMYNYRKMCVDVQLFSEYFVCLQHKRKVFTIFQIVSYIWFTLGSCCMIGLIHCRCFLHFIGNRKHIF